MTATDVRPETLLELAAALEKRADLTERFAKTGERELRSHREKEAALDRAAARALRECDAALAFSQAAKDVLAERSAQVTREGWTPEHDDEHADGALGRAASAYAFAATAPDDGAGGATREHWLATPPPWWPWDRVWWKPKDRRRDLVRAGALILAEIERTDRRARRARRTP